MVKLPNRLEEMNRGYEESKVTDFHQLQINRTLLTAASPQCNTISMYVHICASGMLNNSEKFASTFGH